MTFIWTFDEYLLQSYGSNFGQTSELAPIIQMFMFVVNTVPCYHKSTVQHDQSTPACTGTHTSSSRSSSSTSIAAAAASGLHSLSRALSPNMCSLVFPHHREGGLTGGRAAGLGAGPSQPDSPPQRRCSCQVKPRYDRKQCFQTKSTNHLKERCCFTTQHITIAVSIHGLLQIG